MPSPSAPAGAGPRVDINKLYGALARFMVRYRWFVVVFWILAAILTSALLPSMGSEVNDDNTAFLNKSEPSVKAGNLATPILGAGAATGNSQTLTVVAVRSQGTLTKADMASVNRAITLISKVPNVDSAKLAGIANDNQAAQIRVRVGLSGQDISDTTTLVNAVDATFHRVGSNTLRFYPSGQAADAVASQQHSDQQSNEVQLASFIFVIILLLFVFRSLNAAIITLLPSGIALAIATRVIGAMGQAGVQISSITQVLLIVLLIGAGTDYGLFLVFRVREELREGRGAHEAVERALIRVGESVTGSAGTVVLALLTLLFATFGLYRDLGLPLAVGVLIMLMIALSLLPALLAITGRRAFWPSKVAAGTATAGLWGKTAARLLRRPGVTLAIGVLLFLGLAVGALGYKAGGFGGATKPPAGTPAASGDAALSKHFPHSNANPANLVLRYRNSLWTDATPITKAGRTLVASGHFRQMAGPLKPTGSTTLSPVEFTALYKRLGPPQKLPNTPPRVPGFTAAQVNAYRAAALFISADGHTIQFEAGLRVGGQTTTAAMHATPQIRDVVAAAGRNSGAAQTGLAGEASAIYDINHTANSDLVRIVPIAIIAIGILLALLLRSLVAPWYLIISVALSFLAALGVATIIFIDIGGQGGITFILPFLMFIFLLALGEDYNILVMTRIREEAAKRPLKEAVIEAVSKTGSTVTSAGIILGGTFAVFGIFGGSGSGGSQLQAIGFGLAAGILMDTFLVRTLLVPATVTLLGRWNWWPSHLSSSDHHERVGRSEAEPAGVSD